MALIPQLPVYYVLEQKSTMTIPVQGISFTVVESRISDFMRLHSISYSFHSDSMRLDCGTSGMLKFTVQFWHVSKPQQKSGSDDQQETVTLELQRRQGSAIEMQAIRRELFQFVKTGEQRTTLERQPRQPPGGFLVDDADQTHDPEETRMDAVLICLQLLESSAIDQIKLGLESLMMLTDPSVVSQDDAVAISQDIVFPTSDIGRRFQTALAMCFGVAASSGRTFTGAADHSVNAEYLQGPHAGQLHSMGLRILGHALQLAGEDQQYPATAARSTFDLTTTFWQLVTRDLCYNVERAMHRPHEGSTAARCLRLLSLVKDQQIVAYAATSLRTSSPVAFQTCVAQARKYGQQCHLSLEMESEKLLAMDIDYALVFH